MDNIAEHVKDKSDIWSMQAYILHNESMRDMQQRVNEERDRRYKEVNVEKEKALKIKETADLAALSLARESQVYKDQQADVMREKNLAASGIYATNSDLQNVMQQMTAQQQSFADKMEKALNPLIEFVNGQQGAAKGNEITWGKIFASLGAFGVIVGIIVKFI